MTITTGRSTLQVLDADGSVSVREVLAFVFYMRTPHLELLDQVQRAIWRFVDLVGFQSIVEFYNEDGEQEELNADSLRSVIHSRFLSEDRVPNATLKLYGKDPFAPEFYLEYSGSSLRIIGREDEVSYILCWVPTEFFNRNKADTFEFFRWMGENLPIIFSYANLALAGEDMLTKQALAACFVGIDISYQGSIRTDLGGRAAGVFWLMLFGRELCREIGGPEFLSKTFPEEVRVEALPSGICLLQLSAEPELGDLNRREMLPNYRLLARILNDLGLLHVPKRVVYFVDQEGLADGEAQEAWHTRFLR